jgi:hypothetical protein
MYCLILSKNEYMKKNYLTPLLQLKINKYLLKDKQLNLL